MSAIQVIIAATTGLFVPPMLLVAPVDVEPQPCVVVVQSASGDVACEEGNEIKIVRVVLEQDCEEGAAGEMAKVLVSVSKNDIEPGGPWLGVQFGPVPAPLASHLRLEAGTGQMVMNVAEGSPADDAGFEQYDVIINIDGAKATDAVGEFLDMVRDFEPDETHAFSLIRGGSPTQATVTIGERPESLGNVKYKYEVAPDGLSQDDVFFRGGMLHKNDEGVWSFDRLGDVGNLQHIWECVPEIDGDDLRLSLQGRFFPSALRQYRLRLQDAANGGGMDVEVVDDEEGKIIVTKTRTVDGEETTTTHTYANEQEFEKAEPEAFKARQYCVTSGWEPGGSCSPSDCSTRMLRRCEPGELHDLRKLKELENIVLGIDIDTEHLSDAISEFHKQTGKFKEGRELFKKKLHKRGGQRKLDTLVEVGSSKATTRFMVDSDGKITVTVRRGDDELVEKYDTPKQLKKARPDLYKKYASLLEDTED